MTVNPCFKMVAFDSDERLKRAVDATIRAMEGATGTSQQADQPSVTPASAQARALLPVMERHLRIRCATPDVLAPAAKRPRLHFCRMPRLSWETNDGTGS